MLTGSGKMRQRKDAIWCLIFYFFEVNILERTDYPNNYLTRG